MTTKFLPLFAAMIAAYSLSSNAVAQDATPTLSVEFGELSLTTTSDEGACSTTDENCNILDAGTGFIQRQIDVGGKRYIQTVISGPFESEDVIQIVYGNTGAGINGVASKLTLNGGDTTKDVDIVNEGIHTIAVSPTYSGWAHNDSSEVATITADVGGNINAVQVEQSITGKGSFGASDLADIDDESATSSNVVPPVDSLSDKGPFGWNTAPPLPFENIEVATSPQMLSAGDNHSLWIKNDGTLWAWGSNTQGVLGLGEDVKYTAQPMQVGNDRWQFVTTRGLCSYGIKEGGTLWAWGHQTTCLLSTDDFSTEWEPMKAIGSQWKKFSLGRSYAAAIRLDGSLVIWKRGANLVNQTVVHQRDDWQYISAGPETLFAIKEDGTLWGWGANNNYQLGNGTTDKASSLVLISSDKWIQVEAGNGNTLSRAIRDDGTLWAWGYNANGYFGDNTGQTLTTPTQIGQDRWWTIDSGAGIKADGTLWTWGENTYGQIGDGTVEVKKDPVQIGKDKWLYISTGAHFRIGVKDDGTLWAWGKNDIGQLGNGTSGMKESLTIFDSSTWQSIDAGGMHSVAIKEDGSLWAWGDNRYGQLGDGTGEDKAIPVQIGHDAWKSVSAGGIHTAAIKSDGTLWTWGEIYFGQFSSGEYDLIERRSPILISSEDWLAVSAGREHTVAIKSDGTLWGWGSNRVNQLGVSGEPKGVELVQISDDSWVDVQANSENTIATKADGSVWAWGQNFLLQTIDGVETSQSSSPIQVGDKSWKKLYGGDAIMKVDGTLWFADKVHSGANNVITSGEQLVPAGTEVWESLSLTNYPFLSPVLAIKQDQTLWHLSRFSDTEVTFEQFSEDSWQSVSHGFRHVLALHADGSLWSFGDNDQGQLGNGDAWKSTPQLVSFQAATSRTQDGNKAADESAQASSVAKEATDKDSGGGGLIYALLLVIMARLVTNRYQLSRIS